MAQEQQVINFMGVRKLTSGISIFLVVASIISLAVFGLKGGLDFTGGTQLEVSFDRPANIPQVRERLEAEGMTSPVAVLFGSDSEVMIRTQDQMAVKGSEQIAGEVATVAGAKLEEVRRPTRDQDGYASVLAISGATPAALQQADLFSEARFGKVAYSMDGDTTLVAVEKGLDVVYVADLLHSLEQKTGAQITLRSSEFVGPQIGDELRDQGGLGLLFAFAAVFIYVAFQFQWKFSVGALIALVHDVTITLGFFSVFQWDFDLTVLAAILALIGYSINDTIVIYDRIRENFRVLRKIDPLEVINISITQTLGRSVMTSATVFFVLVCLFVFGGEVLGGFSSALIIGGIVGTYSSIYIAANITVALGIVKEDLMPRPKEDTEIDAMP